MSPPDIMKIVDEHQAALWRYARSLGAERATADDLVQETLLRLVAFWVAIRKRDDPAVVRGWLKTTLLRLWLRHCRRRREQSVGSPSPDEETKSIEIADPKSPTPWEILEKEDQLRSLREAINALSEPEKEIVRQHFLEGATLDELTTKFGLSIYEIRVALERGQVKIREWLLRAGADPAHEHWIGDHPEDGQPIYLLRGVGKSADKLTCNGREAKIKRDESRNGDRRLTLDRAVELLHESEVRAELKKGLDQEER